MTADRLDLQHCRSMPIPSLSPSLTPSRSRRWRPPAIAIVLAAHAALAFAFLVATPMGEAPDEPSHIQYVMYLREEPGLPIVPAEGAARLPQGKHPPLYYALGELLSSGGDFETLGFILNPHFSYRSPDDSGTPAFIHPPSKSLLGTPGERTGRRLRFVSLLAGLLTVFATWRLGRTVWPQAPEVAVASAAVVGFMPGFAFMAGVFNNDALAAAWSAMAIWLSAEIAVREGRRAAALPIGLGIALGTALGLGLITKLTTLPIFAVAAAAILWRARTAGRRWLAQTAALVCSAVLVVGGWWPARNVALYGIGDPLGLSRWSGSIPHLDRVEPLWRELGTYFAIQFTSFWGRFGWVNVPLPDPVYAALARLCALACLGLCVIGFRRAAVPLQARIGLAICAIASGLAYAAALRLGMTLNLVAAHGRYLYVALAPLSVLLVTGLTGWMPLRPRRFACFAIACAMFSLCAYSFSGVLLPTYRAPAALSTSDVDALHPHRIDVDFDGRLRLVAMSLQAADLARSGSGVESTSTVPRQSAMGHTGAVESEDSIANDDSNDGVGVSPPAAPSSSYGGVQRITAGEVLVVQPVWQTLRALWMPPPGDTESGVDPPGSQMFVHVVAADGEVVGRVDASFDGRHPPEAWRPGDAYGARIEVPIAADAAAGLATLIIGLTPLDTPFNAPVERLSAALSDGTPIGDSFQTARLVIVAPDEDLPEPPEIERSDILEGPFGLDGAPTSFELLGFDLARRGDEMELTLHWRALASVGSDLQVFVHLVDSAGIPHFQADGPPVAGRLPTSVWLPGELVLDRRVIETAPASKSETPNDRGQPDESSQLHVLVGLYDLASGERLRARATDGSTWSDGAIDLGPAP